jgi:c-di-GMP phosphodiesterase
VFSLLDRILGQPLDQLSRMLAVPDAVQAALTDQSGPHFPNLELVRAVESESVYDIRAAAETAMVALPEMNRAVLRALAAAKSFD